MFPTALLLVAILFVGAVAAHVAAFGQLTTLRNRLALLEREREKDRELLEAVLLEDPGKLKRLLGTRD
jgi:hypothetical protein